MPEALEGMGGRSPQSAKSADKARGRDTGTGAVLEAMVLPALRRGGYLTQTQVLIGQRWGGGRHLIDVLAQDKDGGKLLVSVKWQQVSGTAEQKVPFEAICLAEAIRASQALIPAPTWSSAATAGSSGTST